MNNRLDYFKLSPQASNKLVELTLQLSKKPLLGMRTAKSSTQPCKAKTWCALTFKWAPVLAF